MAARPCSDPVAELGELGRFGTNIQGKLAPIGDKVYDQRVTTMINALRRRQIELQHIKEGSFRFVPADKTLDYWIKYGSIRSIWSLELSMYYHALIDRKHAVIKVPTIFITPV